MSSRHAHEVQAGQRFDFGGNWTRFLASVDSHRIALAENSLATMLGASSLEGRSFLDVGSGSGLSSLAARRLGATVHSFDYDPDSVKCTAEVRRRFFPNDALWRVEEASALDEEFLRALGQFDVVYSWGVLHHTGAMWKALANVAPLVRNGGLLFIAIYNDQGRLSRYWATVKKLYNRGTIGKHVVIAAHLPFLVLARWIVRRLARRPIERGMSLWHDALDWLGGYPFEVATPEQIFDFYRQRGFELERLGTCGGRMGCNEFVFRRVWPVPTFASHSLLKDGSVGDAAA